MDFTFCANTHTGLRRSNNEDSVVFSESVGLAVLADGMGGYNAGEVASGLATSIINEEMGRWLAQTSQNSRPQEIRHALERSIDSANLAIYEAANSNAQYAGMGTTLVMGVFRGENLLIGHIGDSRCYRLRGNELLQLTRDHSLLQEQLDAGLITHEEAAKSLNRNLVTRAMGVEESVYMEINEYKAEVEDLYLMCSDGLTDMVNHEDIRIILCAPHSLQERAQQLLDAANANGGRDNITVLLVKAGAGEEKHGRKARFLGN